MGNIEQQGSFRSRIEQVNYEGFDVRLKPADEDGVQDVSLYRDSIHFACQIQISTGEIFGKIDVDTGRGYKPDNIVREWKLQIPQIIKEILHPDPHQSEMDLEPAEFDEWSSTPGRRASKGESN